jgi:hypothetical protein
MYNFSMRTVGPAPGKTGTENRILGMKVRQAALLGGLAALDCLALVAGVVVALRALHASPASNSDAISANNRLPAAGETPEFPAAAGDSSTDTPTSTPTVIPSPTSLTGGWIRIGVMEAEIWTPPTYAGGDPHADSAAIVEGLKAKGADYDFDFLEESMAASSENTVLWAIDARQGNPAVVTIILVLYDFPRPGEPLSEYTIRFAGATFSGLTPLERRTIHGSAYEIERLLLETPEGQGTAMSFVYYAVLDQDVVWDILCVTAMDEFDARLPQFDAVADSFRVLSPPS